jgi:hypothetical protein
MRIKDNPPTQPSGRDRPPPLKYQTITRESRQPVYNILREIHSDPNLRLPKRLEVFEIKDPTWFCESHNSKGHDTRDCIALKDELERLARDKNMWAFYKSLLSIIHVKASQGAASLMNIEKARISKK